MNSFFYILIKNSFPYFLNQFYNCNILMTVTRLRIIMDKLLRKLDQRWTLVTRIHYATINDLQSSGTDLIDVQGKLHNLKQKIDILAVLVTKLIDAILGNNSDDIIDIADEMRKADHDMICYSNLKSNEFIFHWCIVKCWNINQVGIEECEITYQRIEETLRKFTKMIEFLGWFQKYS